MSSMWYLKVQYLVWPSLCLLYFANDTSIFTRRKCTSLLIFQSYFCKPKFWARKRKMFCYIYVYTCVFIIIICYFCLHKNTPSCTLLNSAHSPLVSLNWLILHVSDCYFFSSCLTYPVDIQGVSLYNVISGESCRWNG